MTVSSNLQDEQYNDSVKKFGRKAESVTVSSNLQDEQYNDSIKKFGR